MVVFCGWIRIWCIFYLLNVPSTDENKKIESKMKLINHIRVKNKENKDKVLNIERCVRLI